MNGERIASFSQQPPQGHHRLLHLLWKESSQQEGESVADYVNRRTGAWEQRTYGGLAITTSRWGSSTTPHLIRE